MSTFLPPRFTLFDLFSSVFFFETLFRGDDP